MAEGITKRYPSGRKHPARVALEGVSLSIRSGEHVALLGPNGSGKSTLLRILSTADLPDEGTMSILGTSLPASQALRAQVRSQLGVVFQRPGLDPLLTVRENLRTHASLFGLHGAEAAGRIDAIASDLGLTDRLDDRVRTLSGGLVRRADLARALLPEPRLLLLDEATVGLDPSAREEFLRSIARQQSDSGRSHPLTVVTATHLMDEAERAERVILLDRGRIVADAPPAELRSQLGPRVLRVQRAGDDPSLVASLQEFDLSVNSTDEGIRATPASEDESNAGASMEAAAALLIRRGLAFEIAPPTLGDVYQHLTGRTLEAEGPAQEKGKMRGSRHG